MIESLKTAHVKIQEKCKCLCNKIDRQAPAGAAL